MMDSESPVPRDLQAYPDAAQREGPSEEGRDSLLRRIFLLFFRPGTFFAEMDAPKNQLWVAAFALTYGLSYAVGQTETNTLRGQGAPFEISGWPQFWLAHIPIAILAAAFVFSLGGAWYKFRVRLSGTPGADIRAVRRVYLSAAQIVAIPSILYTLIKTFRYETPLDAALADPTWLDTILLVFPFWSLYASFRGVRTVFKTRKAATAIWFLILPGIFVLLAFAFMFYIASSGALNQVSPGPDLDHPREFSSAAMSFSCPGNWAFFENPPGSEGQPYVRIKGIQDMFLDLCIATYAPEEDPGSDGLAEFIAWEIAGDFEEPGEAAPFSEWGGFKGAGRTLTGNLKSIPWQLCVFAAPLAENVYFVAIQVVREADLEKLEPGLKLVRSSFRPVY